MTTDPLRPAFQPLTEADPGEVGGYRLHARLGAGGMGRVYLSYTPGGRPVALKVVRPEFAEDPEFRQRFAQEVASAQRIHALYTAQVIDHGLADATPWLATAYVPGPSLQQVVRQHGALPVRTVLLLVGGIAEALQEIHRVGVVHRDLKPANVLIAGDGPRVIDFGIARAADATMLTSPGLRIGSPAFMAPEQAQDHPVTPATDIWALGALAAYVAGGIPPFGAGPDTAVLYRVVHEDPDLSEVPAELRELVLRCLAKDPAWRPTAAEVIEAARSHPAVGGQLRFAADWLPAPIGEELTRPVALPGEAATALIPPPAPTTVQPRPAPKRRRLRRLALVLGAVVLALGAGGGYLLWSQQRDDSAQPPAAAPSDTASPSPAYDGWTPLYTGVELTATDHSYAFDLKAGKVVPEDSVKWALGLGDSGFYLPEDADAFLAQDDGLNPPDCTKGLDSQPATQLKYADATAGHSFCVRQRSSGEIAVLRVLTMSQHDGPVKVSVDYYQPAN